MTVSDFMDVNDLQTHHLVLTENQKSRNSQKLDSDPGFRYNCPNCNKAYKWRHNMLQHMKRDCGKPPNFMCPYCDYGSKQKNNLARHVAARHKEHYQSFFEDFHKKNTLGISPSDSSDMFELAHHEVSTPPVSVS